MSAFSVYLGDTVGHRFPRGGEEKIRLTPPPRVRAFFSGLLRAQRLRQPSVASKAPSASPRAARLSSSSDVVVVSGGATITQLNLPKE